MNKSNQQHRIVWQKWFDPFGEDDLDNMPSNLISEDEADQFYDEEDELTETDEDLFTEDNDLEFYQKPIRVVLTPMGMIPYTNNTASNKIFNFWVGHTNFNITPYIASIVESTDGVETLDIFTRYRFRIGIGKLFDGATVMSTINDALYQYLESIDS